MGLVIEDGNGFDTMLLEKLEQRPEAADVTLTDECFDVCYYLDCCKNLAPEQPAPSLSAERKEEIISCLLYTSSSPHWLTTPGHAVQLRLIQSVP